MNAQQFLDSVAQSGQAVAPDGPDGLDVVESSGDESDAPYPPGPRSAALGDVESTDEEEPTESAGSAYEFPKIDVSAEGKITINGAPTPKTKVKERLLTHEGDQTGTRPTWAELKAKLAAAKVPGYSKLIEACKKAPAKPKAPATAAIKPKPKQAKPSAGNSALSARKEPTPAPDPAPAPTAQPTPDPTPEPTPAPAPKRTISKPAPARRKRANEDAETDPVPTKVASVASVVQPGGQTTLADMRLAIAAYNDQLGPLGVEFTLTPTERPSIE
tara:strand:- start:9955 stop:10773 length:819 start_codon:yes stop_codon:yes gene_type:complete